jgi:hypothetical protein
VTAIRIYTYASTDERLPEGRRAVARIEMQMATKKGKVIWDYNPVIIHGSTEEEARAKAQAWFDAEEEAARRKRDASIKRADAMRAARAVKS